MIAKVLLVFLTSMYVCKIGDALMFMKQRPLLKPRSNGSIIDGQFDQILDHFSDDENPTWTQRYWYDEEFVKSPDHPIFLRVEGENEGDKNWLHSGQWNTWAEEYGAMMYILEHRFYGKSIPTEDISTGNLKYLTIKQVLADVANFIKEMNVKNNYTSDNKWILFGGSYPGSLVAWSRLHYPEVVTGAISSSSLLNAIVDFKDYLDSGVYNSLEYFSKGCGKSVREAMVQVKSMLESDSPDDVRTVKEKMGICSNTNTSSWLDRTMFYRHVLVTLAGLVQHDRPSIMYSDTRYACKKYLNHRRIRQPIDRLSQYMKKTMGGRCNANYSEYIDALQQTKDSPYANTRLWTYQGCKEFGWFETSETENSLGSDTLPIEFYFQQCADLFGPEFTQEQIESGVAASNEYNQGTDINATNIVFLQGTVDPWHYASIIENPIPESPYILIEGTSHCNDMYNSRPHDLPSVIEARKVAETYIGKWISKS